LKVRNENIILTQVRSYRRGSRRSLESSLIVLDKSDNRNRPRDYSTTPPVNVHVIRWRRTSWTHLPRRCFHHITLRV